MGKFMSKTIKNCFYQNLTFQKLLDAHQRASIGKKTKKEIILFEMDLESNLIRIMDDIKNGTYKFGNYREFTVYEPKERVIKSLPYRDRVVHQWYVEEFIKPYFFKRFIPTTFACLDGRGTHKAVEKVQEYMRKMKKKYSTYYILKCDIKKYFYSIDKEILFSILKDRIQDKKILEFSKIILDDGNVIGIPIGNFTSQYFANIYLDKFDHFVKEELRVKKYVRYMDDFILFLRTKEEAKELLEKIKKFLHENLNLQLNSKSKYFPNKLGIDFCGYRIYETHILLRKRFKKKFKKSIRLWKKLKKENRFYRQKCLLSYSSYKGHAKHSNSYSFIKKMDEMIQNQHIFE